MFILGSSESDRENARRRTDTHTDRLTDANRFDNLSHVICYSYGADNNVSRDAHVINVNVVSGILCRLLDVAEVRTPPYPGVVRGHVGWVGDHRSVVCVELARLVSRTVVVRVTDRWLRTVGHALHTTFRLESARHFVDHSLSMVILPIPSCETAT